MNAQSIYWLKVALGVALFLVVAFYPPPNGLSRNAMLCLAIVIVVIYSIASNVLNEHLAGSMGLILLSFLNVADFKLTFSGFSNGTFILLLGAFGMGGVLSKCGALQYLGNIIVRKFPKTFSGRVNAMYLTGLIITPLMPSGSAKGIVMSLLSTPVAKSMGYKPKSKAGTGIFIAGWVPVGVLGICFLSGAVSGPLLSGMTDASYLGEFTWVKWFLNSLVFGLVMLVGCYVATLVLYKPDPGDIDEQLALQHAEADSGTPSSAMTVKQKMAIAVVLGVLLMWIFGKKLGLADATVSFTGFTLLVLMGVVDRKNAASTAIPWGTMIFVAFVLSVSGVIKEVGLGAFFTKTLGEYLIPVMNKPMLFIALSCLGIYIIRVVVIAQTLVTSMMYLLLMPIAIDADINPWFIGFICSVAIVTWNVLPQSVPFLSAYGASDGGDYPSFPHAMKMSLFVMVWTIVSCWASIPVWQWMGLL